MRKKVAGKKRTGRKAPRRDDVEAKEVIPKVKAFLGAAGYDVEDAAVAAWLRQLDLPPGIDVGRAKGLKVWHEPAPAPMTTRQAKDGAAGKDPTMVVMMALETKQSADRHAF